MSQHVEISNLARFLFERHGLAVVHYAELAIQEMEGIGEAVRADAWRRLRRLLMDLICADPVPRGASVH